MVVYLCLSYFCLHRQSLTSILFSVLTLGFFHLVMGKCVSVIVGRIILIVLCETPF